MKRKNTIILMVLLMTIGFATVSTALFINGSINVANNQEDFDVYFSDVYIDNVQILKTISQDRKTITYETDELTTKGETSILDYEVTNASKQYDAKVNIDCIPKEDEWVKIDATQEKDLIEARSKGTGKITVTLKQNPTEKKKITFSCTLNVSAIERESSLTNEIEPTVIQTWEYDYTGSEQEFIVPRSGEYKIELWGASGGDYLNKISNLGGLGGYTSGIIDLKQDSKLYLYIGAQGNDKRSTAPYATYSFNGASGGNCTCYDLSKDWVVNVYGGSATDIRLINGEWSNFESLKSRIMVAGGGAAANHEEKGASAGGIVGYDGMRGIGGGQVSRDYSIKGLFGMGAIPTYNGSVCNYSILSGAGSGYYGGGHTSVIGQYVGQYSAGGGSSFISGHVGCDAIDETSTEDNIIHTGQPNHYSGLVFTDTVMIDGNGYRWTDVKGEQEQMPKPDGTLYDLGVGHTGNGYVKITYLGK